MRRSALNKRDPIVMTISRRDARPFPSFMRAARFAAALFWAGLAGGTLVSAASPSRQIFTVTDFDSVRLEAPVDVTLVSGKGASAVGIGDRDTLDMLDFQIGSRTLVIRLRSGLGSGDGRGEGRPRQPTRIALTTNELRRATVAGAGTLNADRLKGARTEATVRGSGALTVARVESDRIDMGLLGSGSLTLGGGSALEMIAAVSGSGRADARTVSVNRLRVEMEGAIDAQLAAKDDSIVSVNGSGRLTIAGPTQCAVRKIGSASVSCGGKIY